MDNKLQVNIKMEIVSDGETTLQVAEGILYERPEGWFLRYEEPNLDLGAITATIKITSNQIKLMRRGAVESDMIFEMGVVHLGYYTTPLIEMNIETLTTEFLVELREGKGRVIWSYTIMNQNEYSSTHRVTVWLS